MLAAPALKVKKQALNSSTGPQSQGAACPTDLVLLAQAIGAGRLKLEDLENHTTPGFRYLFNPAQATLEQLRGEVHSLRSGFANAVARGELLDADFAVKVEAALEQVDRALTRSRPICSAVVPHLKRASELLVRDASQQGTSARGWVTARLAPVAATAWIASERLFNA